MARNPHTATPKPDSNQAENQLEIHLEELDFLETVVTQAEINLIEHYFQDLLTDFTKGPPP